MLKPYGVLLPWDLRKKVQECVILPSEMGDFYKPMIIEHPLPPSLSGKFQPPQPIQLYLTKRCTMLNMSTLIRDLDDFLSPLCEQSALEDLLVFFSLFRSQLFFSYLKYNFESTLHDSALVTSATQNETDRLACFVKALEQTNFILTRIFEGLITYDEITAHCSIDLDELNLEQEFVILLKFVQWNELPCTPTTRGLDNVRCLITLFKLANRIHVIKDVCRQYHLKECEADDNLKELLQIADELGKEHTRTTLSPEDAIKRMKDVRKLLVPTETDTDYQYLDVFAKVKDSADFYRFLKEKDFIGDKGQDRFDQQYQLITAQLQHEDYDDQVLNHLYAAFKLITPFMDESQTFTSLIKNVKQLLMASCKRLDATNCLMQLETVNRNIHKIRLWFSRAEVRLTYTTNCPLSCMPIVVVRCYIWQSTWQ